MTESYPKSPSSCYSLPRLHRALRQQKLTSVSRLWLGLQLVAKADEHWLWASQGLKLQSPPLPAVEALEGEHWSVLLEGSQLLWNEAFGFRTQDAFLEAYRLTPRRTEPPNSISPSRVKAWSGFVKDLRTGLEELGLQEVRTPTLVTCPGMEAQLEPFATEWVMGEKREKLFLPTSPELHLKKLLSQGWTDIFEIKSCFRNGELASLHEPEFEMLEWYRAYADLSLIQKDLLKLIRYLGERGWVLGSIPPLEVFTVSELFAQHVELQLTPTTSLEELRGACERWGIPLNGEESWDDVFFLLFLSRVESQLLGDRLVLVHDYPPSQAALARLSEKGWADRFELYWRGVELANAFHELNDPFEQRRRFEQELVLRERIGKTSVPLDEEFLSALDAGMPPSGGIALGVDRLFMVCQEIDDIKDTRCFSARSKR